MQLSFIAYNQLSLSAGTQLFLTPLRCGGGGGDNEDVAKRIVPRILVEDSFIFSIDAQYSTDDAFLRAMIAYLTVR